MTTRKAKRIAIIALTGFGLISTTYGGIGLVTDTLQIPASTLEGTPFATFTVPAMLLGLVVGGSQLLALYATSRDRAWASWATGFAGCTMIGWILGEIALLGSDPGLMRNLQVVYTLVGLLEVLLAAVQFNTQQDEPSRYHRRSSRLHRREQPRGTG